MKGETKRKYARNPEAVAVAEAEQKRINALALQFKDEIKSAYEAKNEAAVQVAMKNLEAAIEAQAKCDKRLDDAKKANQTKDVPLALISTPVRLRIHPSPLKLTTPTMAEPLKLGAKQALPVSVERLYGFADQVEFTLEPPAAAQGLSAEKLTLKKEDSQGKLELTVAGNATPGTHPCTLRAKARFNNVSVESTATIPITITGQ